MVHSGFGSYNNPLLACGTHITVREESAEAAKAIRDPDNLMLYHDYSLLTFTVKFWSSVRTFVVGNNCPQKVTHTDILSIQSCQYLYMYCVTVLAPVLNVVVKELGKRTFIILHFHKDLIRVTP